MSDPQKLTASHLAALMSARICHDLVSPIGALGAAIEVLDDEGNAEMHEDAIELIKLSARQASAKLQFLRLAFGAGGSAPGIIATTELQKLAGGVFGDGKVELVWQSCPNGVDKLAARILLNLIMLAVQAVPRGGNVTITAVQNDSGAQLQLAANGPKARLAEMVTTTLAGGAPEGGFEGRSIQPFFAGLLARETGGDVRAAFDGETVTFTAKIPKQAQHI